MNDDATNSNDPEEEQKPFSMGEVPDAAAPPPAAVELSDETAEEPISVTDKIMGIYTNPMPVFRNLKSAGPRASDWLIPMLFMLVVLVIATVVKFGDPDFLHEIQQQQEERFQKMVDDGDMTQEQADTALEQVESMGSGMMMGISLAGIIIGTPIMFVLIALFYWLVMRFAFKGSATFYLTFAALAMTMYIGALDVLVTLLLGYATGNPFAALSPALFIQYDPENTTYLILSALKPISIWSMVVLAIGFTGIAEISKAKAYGLVFGSWIVVTVFTAVMGWGMGQM